MRKVDNPDTVLHKGQAFTVVETHDFVEWFAGLRDRKAKAKIVGRIRRAAGGNFGDHRSVKGGVYEMRVDYGPGYRVYYFQRGEALVILLCGGDKRTQDADIAYAKRQKVEIETRGGIEAL
ncbi:type II toxin-antitoxin system RelE/ParE family toxin [Leptolyngbya sp. 15MV]|nr:type II toxin-antitoxin system RelE/ParE family toxin [Leptolyngbya sp. 15MV]